MADYFTNFSVALVLPNQEAEQYALDLAQKAAQVGLGEQAPKDFPATLAKITEDWHFETDAGNPNGQYGIWLHSHHGGIDAVCIFIQHLLQKYDPTARVSFEWSNDCSKPRLDAYGGGAAIITATEIKSINTAQWLREQEA